MYSEQEKKYYIKREQDDAKGSVKIVKRDFFDDLPRAVCEVLDTISWRWRNYDWFEEAWNKYRDHVINASASGLSIKAPGFIFNEYIDEQVKENFLNREKTEILHSDSDLEELFHHGIKGQKWGVRRYQNTDGSLTKEGEKRYNLKKDSNGIYYGTAKSKKDIENLSEYMTAEGLRINGDEDRKLILNYLKSKKVNTDHLSIITIKGADMNKAFGLSGNNAYQDNLSIQVFSGLDSMEARNSLSVLGARWMEDIIANNARREALNNAKHCDMSIEVNDQNDEIQHHGIKGQKWGVRRYQNEDGSLTEAGRERYGVESVSDIKPGSKTEKLYKSDVAASTNAQKDILQAGKNITDTLANQLTPKQGSKKVNKKDYSNLSDEELRKKVNRLSLERQYGDLTGDNKYVMTGKEKTREVLQTIGAILGIGVSAVTIAAAVKTLKP